MLRYPAPALSNGRATSSNAMGSSEYKKHIIYFPRKRTNEDRVFTTLQTIHSLEDEDVSYLKNNSKQEEKISQPKLNNCLIESQETQVSLTTSSLSTLRIHKEDVKDSLISPPFSSSLSSGLKFSPRFVPTNTEGSTIIRVILKYALGKQARPIDIPITAKSMSVADFIALALERYNEEGRTPIVYGHSKLFELKFVDDDNRLEKELPPMGHNSDMLKMGVVAVALTLAMSTEKSDVLVSSELSALLPPMLDKRIFADKSKGNSKLFRIIVGPSSSEGIETSIRDASQHLVEAKRNMPLSCLFATMSQIRKIPITEEEFEFCVPVGTSSAQHIVLPNDVEIGELKLPGILLLRKARSPYHPSSWKRARLVDFETKEVIEAASKTYGVLKIQRGRRSTRTLKFSKDMILISKIGGKDWEEFSNNDENNAVGALSASSNSLHSFARVSTCLLSRKLKHPFYNMADVVGSEVNQTNPKQFTILLRDYQKNQITRYEYEAENEKESKDMVSIVKYYKKKKGYSATI